jgi:hypothetical protein
MAGLHALVVRREGVCCALIPRPPASRPHTPITQRSNKCHDMCAGKGRASALNTVRRGGGQVQGEAVCSLPHPSKTCTPGDVDALERGSQPACELTITRMNVLAGAGVGSGGVGGQWGVSGLTKGCVKRLPPPNRGKKKGCLKKKWNQPPPAPHCTRRPRPDVPNQAHTCVQPIFKCVS